MFEKILTSALATVMVAVIAIPLALFSGFVFMIAVGAVHGWIPAVPTVGYWTSVVIAYGLSVLSPLRASADSE